MDLYVSHQESELLSFYSGPTVEMVSPNTITPKPMTTISESFYGYKIVYLNLRSSLGFYSRVIRTLVLEYICSHITGPLGKMIILFYWGVWVIRSFGLSLYMASKDWVSTLLETLTYLNLLKLLKIQEMRGLSCVY